MDRSALVDWLWQESPLFLTREQFEQSLEGWTIDTLDGPNGLALVFVSKGPEFHFAKVDPAFQVTKDTLRKWPGELIERYGYALTRTPKDDTRQLRFNRRLGFYVIGEDQYDVLQRIDALRL